MRLHVLSDLHLEHDRYEPWRPAPGQVDAVVLAGDIWQGGRRKPHRAALWAGDVYGDLPVILVAGNHEAYGGVLERVHRYHTSHSPPSVHFLENEEVVVAGTRFLGCTLWTDFLLQGSRERAMGAAESPRDGMRDYSRIRLGYPTAVYRRLRASDTAAMHVGSLAWLAERLRDTPAGVRRTVVVTHHAPSHRSLSKDVRTDPLAPAYASALDDFVARSGADLWIHGHTHIRCDYYLGNTRVISNPRGYKGEHTGFDPRCVVVTDDSHQGAGRFDLA